MIDADTRLCEPMFNMLITKPNNKLYHIQSQMDMRKWEPTIPKYLLLDYFSKFIYVEEMCTTTAKSTEIEDHSIDTKQ